IEIENAFYVALHLLARVDDARAKLNFIVQGLIGKPAIAFERDPTDYRVLDDADDESAALAAQRHVAEEPGGEESLQRAIDAVGVERVARLHQEIGAHRLGF